jgi:hypothetical protein
VDSMPSLSNHFFGSKSVVVSADLLMRT